MPLRLPLDHLVYGVPDLEVAIDEFESRLGHAPVPGGRHIGLGTHNAILPLDSERYVELIARDPESPDPSGPRPFGLDSLRSPRLVAWAVRSRSIERDVERAREHGFDPGIILDMTRNDPDGQALRWKLTLLTEPFGQGIFPFVIDWGTTSHPATRSGWPPGDVELSAFSGRHPDPERIRSALDALGAELDVESGDRVGMTATLIGPRGRMTLE